MQFIVIARDGTDSEAPARRLAAREAHLTGARAMKADGRLLFGGPILDDSGAMTGSVALVEMDDRGAVEAWLRDDPYVTGDVWRDIEILPFKRTV